MEPLHPDLREALKRAHPDLTDRDIDRFEELSARRFTLDPHTQADELARLDDEVAALLSTRMPHYREVAAAVSPARQPRERIEPRIVFKGQH